MGYVVVLDGLVVECTDWLSFQELMDRRATAHVAVEAVRPTTASQEEGPALTSEEVSRGIEKMHAEREAALGVVPAVKPTRRTRRSTSHGRSRRKYRKRSTHPVPLRTMAALETYLGVMDGPRTAHDFVRWSVSKECSKTLGAFYLDMKTVHRRLGFDGTVRRVGAQLVQEIERIHKAGDGAPVSGAGTQTVGRGHRKLWKLT